jgi:RNA polymerase sigma factor (sigma-70 family)
MSKTALSDRDLLRNYLSGQEIALEILIRRHQKKVFMSILLKVRDNQLADDLFQETLIRVVETVRAGKYNEEGKFSSWMLCIAHNLCMDYFRKGKRSLIVQEMDVALAGKTLPAEESVADREAEMEQMDKIVLGMVNALPDDQREVVMLRMYGNLSFKEVANKTRSNLSTCLGRMRYALINLRKMMHSRGIYAPLG